MLKLGIRQFVDKLFSGLVISGEEKRGEFHAEQRLLDELIVGVFLFQSVYLFIKGLVVVRFQGGLQILHDLHIDLHDLLVGLLLGVLSLFRHGAVRFRSRRLRFFRLGFAGG